MVSVYMILTAKKEVFATANRKNRIDILELEGVSISVFSIFFLCLNMRLFIFVVSEKNEKKREIRNFQGSK